MKKISYVNLSIMMVLFAAFFIFSYPKIGIEYPLSYSRETVEGNVINSVDGPEIEGEVIHLGYLRAWSSLTIEINASSPVSFSISNDQTVDEPSVMKEKSYFIEYQASHSDDYYLVIYMTGPWNSYSDGPYTGFTTDYEVDYYAEIENAETLDLRFAVLLVVGIALAIIGSRKEFYQWTEDPERERRRKSLVRRRSYCNYCGDTELSIWASNIFLEYCSIRCSNGALRYFSLTAAFVTALLAMVLPPYIILSMVFAVPGLVSIEKHKPDYLYRYVPSTSYTPSTRRRRSGPKVPLHIDGEGEEDPDVGSTVGDIINVEELDLTVKVCCYQTARLQEKFCRCGRSVPAPLIEHLSK